MLAWQVIFRASSSNVSEKFFLMRSVYLVYFVCPFQFFMVPFPKILASRLVVWAADKLAGCLILPILYVDEFRNS